MIGFDQTTWTLSCLDELGEEQVIYHYRKDGHDWSWQMYRGHQCPFGTCTYAQGRFLEASCDRCESIKALMSMSLGLILLYDAGFFQEVVITEECEPRTYTLNPSGRTVAESEITRLVTIRRIKKNVLVKELSARPPVINARGSWKARHDPSEIEEKLLLRAPFKMRTRSGKIITVTPTQKKRVPIMIKNKQRREHTVVELYAQRPPAPSEESLP